MARIRTIKPGFFVDDELAELPPLVRLLFIGLWTLADREGRLEDRPRRIRAEVLPYDELDVDAALEQLAGQGKIQRYEVDGERYLVVSGFRKHQQPHMKEAPSTIPPPPGEQPPTGKHGASTVPAPGTHGASPSGREGKGREQEGKGREQEQEHRHGREREGSPPGEHAAAPASLPADLVALWNAMAAEVGLLVAETNPRTELLALVALRERPLEGPRGWRRVVARVGRSAFLTGRKRNKDFAAGFSWLVTGDHAERVLSGDYHDPWELEGEPTYPEAA